MPGGVLSLCGLSVATLTAPWKGGSVDRTQEHRAPGVHCRGPAPRPHLSFRIPWGGVSQAPLV